MAVELSIVTTSLFNKKSLNLLVSRGKPLRRLNVFPLFSEKSVQKVKWRGRFSRVRALNFYYKLLALRVKYEM